MLYSPPPCSPLLLPSRAHARTGVLIEGCFDPHSTEASSCDCVLDVTTVTASCTGARLDKIPVGLWPNVTALHFASNTLTRLDAEALRLSTVLLNEVDFSSNAITILEADAFIETPNLLTLRLAENPLSHGAVDAFLPLTRLVSLFLASTRLTALPAALFRPLRALKTLDLRWNPAISFEGHAFFEGLPSLNNLYLAKGFNLEVHNDSWAPARSLPTTLLQLYVPSCI